MVNRKVSPTGSDKAGWPSGKPPSYYDLVGLLRILRIGDARLLDLPQGLQGLQGLAARCFESPPFGFGNVSRGLLVHFARFRESSAVAITSAG